MRYAVISDLHSNRQALDAVLTDIRSIGVDEIICLGDVIGYGPNPAETLELAYGQVHRFVLGNHDAVIAGRIEPECFNDKAKATIEWTRRQLGGQARKFFRKQPLVLKGENFRFTHGEFSCPEQFMYIFEPSDAKASFGAVPDQLLFTGHSHIPGIHVIGQSKQVHWLKPVDFSVEAEKRYIVNVGSVGDPRDGDLRASYCILDLENSDVTFRKVPFDVKGYADAYAKARLPDREYCFLNVDAANPKPLRQLVGFKPPERQQTQRRRGDSEDIVAIKKKLRVTKRALLAMCAALLTVIISGSYLFAMYDQNSEYRIDALDAATGIVTSFRKENLLEMPKKYGEVNAEHQLRCWSVALPEPNQHSITVIREEGSEEPVFRIANSEPGDVRISSPLYEVRKSPARVTVAAQFKRVKFAGGHVAVSLVQVDRFGNEKPLLFKEPRNLRIRDGWLQTSATIEKRDALKEKCQIRYVISGNFKGEILVRKCSMEVKK